MSDALCLQNWVTVSGNNNTVVQSETDWLEIAPYQDLAVYVEVSSATGTGSTSALNLDIQTSPTKDEAFFAGTPSGGTAYVANFSFATSSPTLGVQPVAIVRWSATTTAPPGRFLRWRLRFANAAQSITFRIWLSLNRMP